MTEKFTTEKFQEFVVKQFGSINKEFGSVRQQFAEIRSDIREIKDILEPLARAVDTDAETIVEHDNRLTRVEKHLGIAK